MSLCLKLIEEIKQNPQLARQLISTIAEVAPDAIAKLLGIELLFNELKKLREDFNKMISRIESLERRHAEDVEKILARLESLERRHAEDVEKILARLESLERRHAEDTNRIFSVLSGVLKRLEVHDKMLKYLMGAVARLDTVIGKAFESFARETVEEYLKDLGVIPRDAKLTSKRFNGGLEINIFLENPLILGEITSFIFEEREIEDMINKIETVEKMLGKRAKEKVIMASLILGKDLAEKAKRLCREKGVRLIVGKNSRIMLLIMNKTQNFH